ncbi:hypothetical protein V6N11_007823 [Hibiscus sabdariffa]|uniref:Uncharacterized protein n=1 Tax=Hibiscus sabdariffa TaxID=183260 RepID=A0ABR2NJX0_9ROSI
MNGLGLKLIYLLPSEVQFHQMSFGYEDTAHAEWARLAMAQTLLVFFLPFRLQLSFPFLILLAYALILTVLTLNQPNPRGCLIVASWYPDWNTIFPKAVALLDIAIGSNHVPIIVLFKGLKRKYKKDFKFESKWLLEEDCTTTVQDNWVPISQPITSIWEQAKEDQIFSDQMEQSEVSCQQPKETGTPTED